MNILEKVTKPLRLNTWRSCCIFRFSGPLRKNNTRSYSFANNSGFQIKHEGKFRLQDKMPKRIQIVYNNPFATYIEWGFHVQSIILLIGTPITIYYAILFYNKTIPLPIITNDKIFVSSTLEFVSAIGITFFFILMTCILFKKSVLRIYFDKAENVSRAVFIGALPLKREIITIKPNSVTPKLRKYFSEESYSTFEYSLNGKRIYLVDEFFRTPEDLNRMLKYNKAR